MSTLGQPLPLFVDDGRKQRSGESFQGLSFFGLNQSIEGPISFFRSDFRKARILDCQFRGNNFSRCDFVSTIFRNTTFTSCDFLSSSIMYSVFENCIFEENLNFNPDLISCQLVNCEFRNQSVERATWQSTVFENCTFTNFQIDKSTLKEIEFKECIMPDIDLSQIQAADLKFLGGSLAGVKIDPDHLGTYTFEKIELSAFKFSYRARDLDLSAESTDDLQGLGRYLEEQQRWSEAFNIYALVYQIRGDQSSTIFLERQWLRCFMAALELEITTDAAENIRRLFYFARHYLVIGLIAISGAFRLTSNAQLLAAVNLSAFAREEIASGAGALMRAVTTIPNFEHALSTDAYSSAPIQFQIQIDTEDETLAKEGFLAFINAATAGKKIPFQIHRVGFGSVVIEGTTWLVIIMMFFKAARSASYTFVEIRLLLKAHSRLAQLIEQSTQPKAILDTVKKFQATLPRQSLTKDLTGKEVEQIGRKLHGLAQNVKLSGVTFLALVREIRIFVDDLQKPR